jgi:prephenate dehydrogenase (NADP+)
MLAGGNGTEEDRRAFKDRVEWGREAVFGDTVEGSPGRKKKKHRPILLHESVLDKFSLGKPAPSPNPSLSSSPEPGFADPLLSPDHPDAESGGGRYHPHRQASTIIPTLYRANSNLSLLAMVDSWAHLKINPYKHLSLAATPLFRLFLGVAEHLFLSPSLLRASVHSALYDTWHRSDDLEFVIAARGWSQSVSFGTFEVYKRRFMKTRAFLESRFAEGVKVGSEMIKAVMETEVQREKEESEEEESEGAGVEKVEKL